MIPLNGLEQCLSEAWNELFDNFVDPRDAWQGEDGAAWLPLGGELAPGACAAVPADDRQLREVRNECRRLAATNEFAINGHENRISYIVGPGHTYRAIARAGRPVSPDELRQAQDVLDDFLLENRWQQRQQEIVRRLDRDGEAFLRLFAEPGGRTLVRFIEPGQVVTPSARAADPAASFGIETDPHDVERVLGYYVDGELLPADEIMHRKANVDANVKRGLPLFYPVRKNLRRAEKILRNMSVVAEVQSAIALIRKHRGASRHGVQEFVAQGADATLHAGARPTHVKRYGPGTILDAPAGLEYEFPAASVDAASFVTILQAELRAIAARLVMPEFMLTADASNANFASTLVAEGPAMRMFARWQAEQVADDRLLMRRVLHAAAACGVLHSDVPARIDVQIEPPSLEVRNTLAEVRAYAIEHEHGILSKQTWCQRRGLDYEQERANLAAAKKVEKVDSESAT